MIAYFLGANTPKGFYSLYDELIDRKRARAVYILKGGPGCGKSTLMKKVGAAAETAGYPVEYIRCSGDPESLDALLLPAQGAAIVDGTAPHVIEPKLPGAVDHYVNLEPCYDGAALAGLREELEKAMAGYQGCYGRAYRCLAAAETLRREGASCLTDGLSREKLTRRVKALAERELRRVGTGEGTITRRFLSAVTCQGRVCLWDTVEERCGKVYVLEDSIGLSHRLLLPLMTAAAAAGHDVTACLSPTAPERLEHLLLPGLGLAFVTSTPGCPYPGKKHRRLRLDTLVEPELMRAHRSRLRFTQKLSDALEEEAVRHLAQAKAMHDTLEGLYHPHVDFRRVNAQAEELMGRLGWAAGSQ